MSTHPQECKNSQKVTANSYCERLAAIVSLPEHRLKFRNALAYWERDSLLGADLEGPPTEWLAKELINSPRLQSIAATCTSYTPSVWLLEQELRARGKSLTTTGTDGTLTADDIYRAARDQDATGLCLSGGGIRSATFNLGILQGLAQLHLIDRFDYLSSVSGGGYIHQFLAAWLYNRNCLPLRAERPDEVPYQDADDTLNIVEQQLQPLPQRPYMDCSPLTQQPDPLRWLRRYSNYLTPQKGLFTTDTWVLVAIWLRNTFLNQIVLVSLLACVLLLPRLLMAVGDCATLRGLYKLSLLGPKADCFFPAVLVLGIAVAACIMVGRALISAQTGRTEHPKPGCEIPAPKSKDVAAKDPSIGTGAARWSWLLLLLACIAAIASPAVYQASFPTNPPTGQIHLDASPNNRCAGDKCHPPVYEKASTSIRRGMPSCIERQQMTGLTLWFRGHTYPLWLSFRDPGFDVEAVFLVFTLAFCLVAGLCSLELHRGKGVFWCVVGAFIGAAGAWAVLCLGRLGIFLLCFWCPVKTPEIALTFLPLVVMSALFFALVLNAGIVGRRTDDSLREAMARLRALGFLLSWAWMALCAFSLLGPPVLRHFFDVAPNRFTWKQWSTVLTWIGGVVGGVVSGNNKKTSGDGDKSSLVSRVLIKIAPPLFIVGILLLISLGMQTIVDGFCIHSRSASLLLCAKLATRIQDFFELFQGGVSTHIGDLAVLFHLAGLFCRWLATYLGHVSGLFLALVVVAALFGSRLDINDFSMHAFYRDRLARCYAGASFPRRRPNRFTGFAQSDGRIRVADLLPRAFRKGNCAGIDDNLISVDDHDITDRPYPGPFPIFCTTVNLTFGQDLAWQERKGASFAFTPLYSGYSPGWTASPDVVEKDKDKKRSYNGFTVTRDFAYEDCGIPMHSAVAISGAAVSPNWGYHSDPAMAFLLTVFNVRLGWWIKNPRVQSWGQLFDSPSPPFPAWNLLSELLGYSTDMSHYVNLTDGGHFDNMGLYELVRRRCRRILICDAEEDGKNVFQGIAMAIRKCRVDFGAEIDLPLVKMDPSLAASKEQPHLHYIEGSIRYPGDDSSGTVIYVKTRVTGDEPADILSYRREHPEFPNESTADQWFTESQFESYRRLGYHSIFGSSDPEAQPTPLIRGQWQPPLGQRLKTVLHCVRDSPA